MPAKTCPSAITTVLRASFLQPLEVSHMLQPHADDNLHHRGRDKSHDYSVFTTKKDEINGLLGKDFSAKRKG